MWLRVGVSGVVAEGTNVMSGHNVRRFGMAWPVACRSKSPAGMDGSCWALAAWFSPLLRTPAIVRCSEPHLEHPLQRPHRAQPPTHLWRSAFGRPGHSVHGASAAAAAASLLEAPGCGSQAAARHSSGMAATMTSLKAFSGFRTQGEAARFLVCVTSCLGGSAPLRGPTPQLGTRLTATALPPPLELQTACRCGSRRRTARASGKPRSRQWPTSGAHGAGAAVKRSGGTVVAPAVGVGT
jgi:hypothetical protein